MSQHLPTETRPLVGDQVTDYGRRHAQALLNDRLRPALVRTSLTAIFTSLAPLLHPSVMQRLFQSIGGDLAQVIREHYRHVCPSIADSPQEEVVACARYLTESWGFVHRVVETTESRVTVALPECPVLSPSACDAHYCGVYAGMLKELVFGRVEYANVSLQPGHVHHGKGGEPQPCRVVVYVKRAPISLPAASAPQEQAEGPLSEDRLGLVPAQALPADRLTHREWEVLRLIGQGYSDKEIAATLQMSVRTAENHAARIYTKLGIRGRARLIHFALSHQIVEP